MIADPGLYQRALGFIANVLTSAEIHALKPVLRNSIFVQSLNEGGFLFRESTYGPETMNKLQLTTAEAIVRVIKRLQAKSTNYAGNPYQQLWACKT